MTDGEVFLEAPSAVHYSDQDSTLFSDGVSYRDSLTVLTAERAIYLSENNIAHFASRVELSQEDIRVFSDSMKYERDAEISHAWGRILIEQKDDSSATFMLADRMIRKAKVDSVQLVGNAMMASLDSTQSDTVFVIAGRFRLTERDSLNVMEASDSVVVSASGYAIRTDSLLSVRDSSDRQRNTLFGTPFTWLEDTQVSADSLTLTSAPAEPDSVFGFGSVFVASRESSSDRIQQLKSRLLVAVVENDSLRSLVMEQNAEALFFTRESDEDPITAVRASGDGAVFAFKKGDLSDVRFYTGVEGTYYAESQMDKLSNLAGYIWVPENKPDRDLISRSFWEEVELRRHSVVE